MSTVDWFVLVASLIGIVGYGLYKSKGAQTTEGYLLGGKSMRWWVIGLSIMATQASAITFIGTTGQGYSDGLRFVQFYFGLPIAMVIICAVAAPVFHRSGVYTAYEFLEKRFDTKTRTLASAVFLVQRGLGVGIALYAPAVVMAVILNWPEKVTILFMAAIVVGYTVIGGIKAVMWTDAQQMLVMLLGLVAAFFAAVHGLPSEVSFGDALRLAGEAGRLQAINLELNFDDRYNLWSGLIGGSFLALAYFGTDQSQVQRYLTARSLRDSRFSLLLNAVVKVPLQFVILLTGAMVFVFFLFIQPPALFNPAVASTVEAGASQELALVQQHYDDAFKQRREAALNLASVDGPGQRDAYLGAQHAVDSARNQAVALAERTTGEPYNDTNYVFLTFVTRHLPPGIVGLIIAAVFAAAMSTISAELNSLATVSIIDHYQRYIRRGAADQHYTHASRAATAFWGVYAAVFATFAGQLGSLIEAVNIVGSLFYGAMLGVFILAFAPWKTTGTGAFLGILCGLLAVAATQVYSDVTFLWFNVIGAAVTVSVGLAVSRLKPATT
ncbi:MAG: sodium:solute symporter [Acidobacteria bacterium]|nr:sodium:solute symporter [Acidobacteriota bacterium]MDA1234484.1 sodium:solute symporter [Acidobacteriota bacterium]